MEQANPPIQSKITSKILISFGISFINFFLIYLLNIFLANQLGEEDYGDYIVAITTANFFALITTLGLEKSALRFLPVSLKQGDHAVGHGLLRYSLIVISCASLGCAVIGTLVMGLMIRGGFERPLILALWLIPVMTLIKVLGSWIRSTQHYLAAQLPNMLQEPILTLGILYLIFLLNHPISHYLALKLVGVSLVTVIIIQIVFLKKFLPKEMFQESPVYESKKWLGTSLSLLFSTLIFLAMQQTDIWLLDLFGKNDAVVGAYSAIARTTAFYILILTTAIMFLSPLVSQLFEMKKIAELQRLVIKTQRILMLFSLFFTVVIALYGRQILGFFGDEFVENYPELLIATVGACINLLLGLALMLLQNGGYEKWIFKGALTALVVHIILDFIFIPRFVVLGAVLTSTITISLLYIWYTWLAWRKFQIRLLPF